MLPSDAKARYYFDQLFTVTLWVLLVVETNRYAQHKGKPFDVTSIAEMKAFVGLQQCISANCNVFLTTGVRTGYMVYYSLHNCVRRIDSYLCGTMYILRIILLGVPQFAQVFAKNRFISLWYNDRHVVDNSTSVPRDRSAHD